MRQSSLPVWRLLADNKYKLDVQNLLQKSKFHRNPILIHIAYVLNMITSTTLKFITLGQMLSIQLYLNSQKQALQNNIEAGSLLFFVPPTLKNSHFYLLVQCNRHYPSI